MVTDQLELTSWLVLWCGLCRVETRATEAVWLEDVGGALLAEFPPLCAHAPVARTVTATLEQITPPADRCAGQTAAGAWCRAWPRTGRRYCRAHLGQEVPR